ncbi:MAG: hypothetical protein HYV63_07265 [Candidatus Schekmanbacteria bacterium]|nr:hypothetical protein [Candidatus Schekmanbacteria bacterium]
MAAGATILNPELLPGDGSFTLLGDGATDEIEMILAISARQPGNNFAVVAHTSQEYLESVGFAADGVTLVVAETGAPVGEAFRTPLLTVWRTLYVERDIMADPDLTQEPGPSRIPAGAITAKADLTMTIGVEIDEPGGTDQFSGGTIALYQGETLLNTDTVVFNTTGPGSRIVVRYPVPALADAFRDLVDDDVAHAVTAADIIPDLSLMASRFLPACVRVDTAKNDLSSNSSESVDDAAVAFKLNVGTLGTNENQTTEKDDLVKANKQAPSSPDFWVAYVLGAFQGRVDKDADPDREDWILGFGGRGSSSGPFALLYRESVRDVVVAPGSGVTTSEADLWRLVAVHEVAHEFGLLDKDKGDDGPLMNNVAVLTADTPAEVEALQFNGVGLRKIVAAELYGRN